MKRVFKEIKIEGLLPGVYSVLGGGNFGKDQPFKILKQLYVSPPSFYIVRVPERMILAGKIEISRSKVGRCKIVECITGTEKKPGHMIRVCVGNNGERFGWDRKLRFLYKKGRWSLIAIDDRLVSLPKNE